MAETQQWMVHAFPRGSIKPFPNMPQDYSNILLERLIEQNDRIVRSWRLFLKPGAILQHLNLERKITSLNSTITSAPTPRDWIRGVAYESGKIALYVAPLVTMGIKAYQAYTGNQ
jgi:hypothetical protein